MYRRKLTWNDVIVHYEHKCRCVVLYLIIESGSILKWPWILATGPKIQFIHSWAIRSFLRLPIWRSCEYTVKFITLRSRPVGRYKKMGAPVVSNASLSVSYFAITCRWLATDRLRRQGPLSRVWTPKVVVVLVCFVFKKQWRGPYPRPSPFPVAMRSRKHISWTYPKKVENRASVWSNCW